MNGGIENRAVKETAGKAAAEFTIHAETLREMREFLDEVKEVTDETSRGELNSFAMVLLQLLDLLESWQEAGQPAADETKELAEFVEQGLAASRSSLDDDSKSLQQVEQLTNRAVDRWGDFLTLPDEADFDTTLDDAWRDVGTSFRDEVDGNSGEIHSPSGQEIHDLLAQLAESSPSTATASPEPLHASAAAPPDVSEIHAEIREAFLDDAGRCVSSIEEALLTFESNPKDRDPLQQICRELHTLKGASGSIGLMELADYLHNFEDSLRDSNAARCALPSIEVLFGQLDTIRKQIECFAAPSGKTPQEPRGRESVDNGRTGDAPAPSALANFADAAGDEESVRVKSSQLNRLMDMLAELVMLRNRRDSELSELKEIQGELIHSVSRLRSLGDGAEVEGLREARTGEADGGRHSMPRLTEVANDVLEAAQRLRDCYRPVAEGNLAVSQFIRQFRQELVELRRMPVSGLFRRLQRVASDAARAERKQVHLRLVGEDAGIERSLQERLYEPLLHIIRNAVSHGIEDGEERVRQGKDPVGQVILEARTGPDLLVLEIRDDGRGLNYDALRRRGIETGLLRADKAATREELSLLIFQPGFSTQQTASQISGRGVGMDVVASAIARMRGWVEVDSVPGQGTTVLLTFPLPSVIQHTMVFRSAGQMFALPMQFVQAAGNAAEEARTVHFGRLFGSSELDEESAAPTQMLVLSSEATSSGASEADHPRLALLVDEIVGPEEVVVRPMPSLLKHHPLCSGATLSGMGEVVLVLDKHRLMELANRQSSPRSKDRRPRTVVDRAVSEIPAILVVDDSLSARKRLVRSLNRYAVEITEASDGKEASDLLKTQSFAAIFSDLEMPRQSGFELLAEIRSGASANDVPVVIISSRTGDEVQHRAAELGATAYLTKPLADEALDGVLAKIPVISAATIPPTSLSPHSGEIQ